MNVYKSCGCRQCRHAPSAQKGFHKRSAHRDFRRQSKTCSVVAMIQPLSSRPATFANLSAERFTMPKFPKFPTSQDMLELWLTTHFAGVPACVACHPLSASDAGQKAVQDMTAFGDADIGDYMSAEFVVIPAPSTVSAFAYMKVIPEEDPFCYVWDGKKIVGHHS